MKIIPSLFVMFTICFTLPSFAKQSCLKSGIDQSYIDKAVRAQDDFFRYVNGQWIKTFVIPEDKSNFGTFTVLVEKAKNEVKAIIEDADKTNQPNPQQQKIGHLYHSFMDTKEIERVGIKPLQQEIKRIDSITDLRSLSAYLAYAQKVSTAPFSIYVSTDQKDPKRYVTYIHQSGLGLPNRDYYLKDDEKNLEIKKKYLSYMQTMFTLSKLADGKKRATRVLAFETELAKAQWTKERRRDPVETYNKTSIKNLREQLSNLNWQLWFDHTDLPKIKQVVVLEPSYLDAVNTLLTSTPLATWKDYFRWHSMASMAPFMSKAFVDQSFDFHGTVLSGTTENTPRWKRGVGLVNAALGEAVGKEYVRLHFPAEAKKRMLDLVENLRAAYAQSIKELDWMSRKTKRKALKKLKQFNPKIGYPESFRIYSGLRVDKNNLFQNILTIRQYQAQYNRNKLGKAVDPDEWLMTPQTVNAYYNPSRNEIVFPAAILQPPFFDLTADDAVNYGAIGAVIGHEMGHGFDDKGSKYDGTGKLENWWTDADRAAFEKSTKKLVDQYNGYYVFKDLHVNGEFTQGENIGDLSGLTIALKAYHIAYGNKTPPVLDGLTGEQRFFFSWAQVWRRKYRDVFMRKVIQTDPHAPAEFRVNGVLRNMPAFYQAFKVNAGDGMYLDPKDRVKIW